MTAFWFLWAIVCVMFSIYNGYVAVQHPNEIIFWMLAVIPIVCALYSFAKAIQK